MQRIYTEGGKNITGTFFPCVFQFDKLHSVHDLPWACLNEGLPREYCDNLVRNCFWSALSRELGSVLTRNCHVCVQQRITFGVRSMELPWECSHRELPCVCSTKNYIRSAQYGIAVGMFPQGTAMCVQQRITLGVHSKELPWECFHKEFLECLARNCLWFVRQGITWE